jgi:hypothetical protein
MSRPGSRCGLVPSIVVWTLACAGAAPAEAKPDFSKSTIAISPAAPAEGDVVTFTVTVVNSGDSAAPFADVKFELPLEAMLVDVDGLPKAQVNAQEKVLGGTMSLDAGATRLFRVRMVIPRDAGGRVLTPDLTVRYFHEGVEFYGHEVYDIDSRVDETGLKVGPVRVTPVGVAVLIFIAAFPVLWLVLWLLLPRGRLRDESGVMRGVASRIFGPATAAFAILLPLAFWSLFAAMAVRDWRSAGEWPQTACVITDSRIREEAHASSGGNSLLHRTRTTASRSFEPLLALRYRAGDRELISTGFHTGSHLRIGGRARAEANVAAWPIGATVPCWYDPAHPRDVVVRNGFGGSYLFALFPLPIAVFAVYRVRALFRRR